MVPDLQSLQDSSALKRAGIPGRPPPVPLPQASSGGARRHVCRQAGTSDYRSPGNRPPGPEAAHCGAPPAHPPSTPNLLPEPCSFELKHVRGRVRAYTHTHTHHCSHTQKIMTPPDLCHGRLCSEGCQPEVQAPGIQPQACLIWGIKNNRTK